MIAWGFNCSSNFDLVIFKAASDQWIDAETINKSHSIYTNDFNYASSKACSFLKIASCFSTLCSVTLAFIDKAHSNIAITTGIAVIATNDMDPSNFH